MQAIRLMRDSDCTCCDNGRLPGNHRARSIDIFTAPKCNIYRYIYDPNKTITFSFPKQKYSLHCLNRTISAHVTSCRDRCNFLFGECVHD